MIQKDNDYIKDIRTANIIADRIYNTRLIKEIWNWSWQVNIQDNISIDIRKILEQNIILSHSVLLEFISSILSHIFSNYFETKKEKKKVLGMKYLVKIQNLPTENNVLDLFSKWIEIKYVQSKSVSPDVIFVTFEIKTFSNEIIKVTLSKNL